MNKLNVTLIALALVACLVVPSRAYDEELVNEIEDDAADVDESADGGVIKKIFGKKEQTVEEENRPYWVGGVEEQYGRDIIQKGIEKTVAGRSAKCSDRKDQVNCASCCEEANKEGIFKSNGIKVVYKFSSGTCYCSDSNPKPTPE